MYLDDILIKSAQAENLMGDLKETFAILQGYSLKLNPSKCVFDVRSGII